MRISCCTIDCIGIACIGIAWINIDWIDIDCIGIDWIGGPPSDRPRPRRRAPALAPITWPR
jgi:hypothetical protein